MGGGGGGRRRSRQRRPPSPQVRSLSRLNPESDGGCRLAQVRGTPRPAQLTCVFAVLLLACFLLLFLPKATTRHAMYSLLLLDVQVIWPRGVTVSTLDSESSDRGSNPREALNS